MPKKPSSVRRSVRSGASSGAPGNTAAGTARAAVVLAAVLRLLRPAVRLLLKHGVTHRSFSVALKQVFLEAAQDELAERGMPATDSAITLLCGVHRRDVRTLLRPPAAAVGAVGLAQPAGLASEVVSAWLAERRWRQRNGRLRVLPRGTPGADDDSFDALVESISHDVRPRALLDELLRLGLVQERDDGAVELLRASFTPSADFSAVSALVAENVHDHLAAAAENLAGGHNHLEQAVFVDEIGSASADALREVAVQAWKQAFARVMASARERFDHDQTHTPAAERTHRARFGVYFYSTPMDAAATGDAVPEKLE
jgi:Family of unknown function (DUF6502)